MTPFWFASLSNLALAETTTTLVEQNEKEILEAKAHEIISSQIDAFQKSDITTAYSFASPVIKSKFASAKIFGRMVESGYPMIWSPKEYKFLEFNFFNGSLIQRVLFVDSQNRIFMFDYELKQYQPDNWLINGVFLVQSAMSGA